jgi:hypothetical protein
MASHHPQGGLRSRDEVAVIGGSGFVWPGRVLGAGTAEARRGPRHCSASLLVSQIALCSLTGGWLLLLRHVGSPTCPGYG